MSNCKNHNLECLCKIDKIISHSLYLAYNKAPYIKKERLFRLLFFSTNTDDYELENKILINLIKRFKDYCPNSWEFGTVTTCFSSKLIYKPTNNDIDMTNAIKNILTRGGFIHLSHRKIKNYNL